MFLRGDSLDLCYVLATYARLNQFVHETVTAIITTKNDQSKNDQNSND